MNGRSPNGLPFSQFTWLLRHHRLKVSLFLTPKIKMASSDRFRPPENFIATFPTLPTLSIPTSLERIGIRKRNNIPARHYLITTRKLSATHEVRTCNRPTRDSSAIGECLRSTSLIKLTIHKKMHDSRFVTAITTFSTKTITMKTTVQQTPPFTSRSENRVPRLSCTNRTQFKIYQQCTTKEPNSSFCVCFGGGNLNSN
jgi:hypothetical protein